MKRVRSKSSDERELIPHRCLLRSGPCDGESVKIYFLPHDSILRLFKEGTNGRIVKAPYMIQGFEQGQLVADYIGT